MFISTIMLMKLNPGPVLGMSELLYMRSGPRHAACLNYEGG